MITCLTSQLEDQGVLALIDGEDRHGDDGERRMAKSRSRKKAEEGFIGGPPVLIDRVGRHDPRGLVEE